MSDVKPVAWHIGQNTPQREIGIHFSTYSTDDTRIEIMRTAGHRVTALYSQEAVLALQAEIEALRKDAERLDYLANDMQDMTFNGVDVLDFIEEDCGWPFIEEDCDWPKAWRKALDAAIAKEKQQESLK